jgi:hypothetical protein
MTVLMCENYAKEFRKMDFCREVVIGRDFRSGGAGSIVAVISEIACHR